MAGRSIWRLRKPHFSTALLEKTLDEGKFQVEISPPSLSRDGNGVGGGILLAAVARAKVVPLSSRMPLKYIFLSVLFRCIAFHDYTFAPRCTHLTLFHPIDFISSGTYHLFYSYTRLDVKKTRERTLFQSISKKITGATPRRLYFIRFRFLSSSRLNDVYPPVWLKC